MAQFVPPTPVIVPTWTKALGLHYRIFLVDPGELGAFLPADSTLTLEKLELVADWIKAQVEASRGHT